MKASDITQNQNQTAASVAPLRATADPQDQLGNPPTSPGLPVLHSAGRKSASQTPLTQPHPSGSLPSDARALPTCAPRYHTRRNGRIASLPKLYRDIVGRMVWNSVPYKNIVGALEQCDFVVTERNISNWVTRGGYLEWRAELELVLQNRLDQDHLVDHLRRDDASELSEVGLQAAATRLSQMLVRKTACAEDLEVNLDRFSRMVDVLCRLNREIALLQKQRDDSRRTLGPAHDPVRIKNYEATDANGHERFYSDPPVESNLPKPPSPPALPPEPIPTLLAQMDREAEQAWKLADIDRANDLLHTLSNKTTSKDLPKPPTTPT